MIVRCEILDPWEIKENCPEDLMKDLRRIGSVVRETIQTNASITMTGEGFSEGGVEKAKQWFFSNPERGYTIVLSHDHFSLEYTRYESIDDLITLFNSLKTLLEKAFGEFTVKKLGFRFIDIFEFGSDDPLNWDEFITPEYLVTTSTIPPSADRKCLARAFNRIEYTYPDDMRVIVNYGIHNPSYPSPVQLRQYILDTDVQSIEFLKSEDLAKALNRYQSKANQIFESAITNEVRRLMNE